MSKGKEGDRPPRTLHAATNEEKVEEFVLKGWPAGNLSQPATGFQDFTEARYFPILSLQSPTEAQEILTD